MEDEDKRHMLHHPRKLTGWLHPDYQQGSDGSGPVLRDTVEYMDFLLVFGRFGARYEEFKARQGSSLYSSFVPESMEAFLVIVYVLHYHIWLGQARGEVGGGGGGMAGRPTKLWTRGHVGGGGWSDDAHDMYSRVTEHIKRQRREDRSFDRALQEVWLREIDGPGRYQQQQQQQKPAPTTSEPYMPPMDDVDYDF
jgi:hypothetical protein